VAFVGRIPVDAPSTHRVTILTRERTWCNGDTRRLSLFAKDDEGLRHPPRHFDRVYLGDTEPRLMNQLKAIGSHVVCAKDVTESVTQRYGVLHPLCPKAERRISYNDIHVRCPIKEVLSFFDFAVGFVARGQMVIKNACSFGRVKNPFRRRNVAHGYHLFGDGKRGIDDVIGFRMGRMEGSGAHVVEEEKEETNSIRTERKRFI